jgi:hypothetical protein
VPATYSSVPAGVDAAAALGDVPSGVGVGMLPSTGATPALAWLLTVGTGALLMGLALFLWTRRRAVRSA